MSKIEIETLEHHNSRSNLNTSVMKTMNPDEIKTLIVSGFRKKIGIKYCLSCGSETKNDENQHNCDKCGATKFLDNHLSSLIGGYIDMAKNGNLKAYYKKAMKIRGNSVRMNEKRYIMNLLIHKENANIPELTIQKIYNNYKS